MRYQRLKAETKASLRMAVLMLRFHTTKPTTSSPTFAHYREIAQALNLAYNEIQYICR